MDVLSEVLLAVRLNGAVFFDIDARPPFVTESPEPDVIAGQVRADSEHLIAFHVVAEGSCWAYPVDGQHPAVQVSGGEIVIYPAGDANVLASTPGMRARPDPSRYHHPSDRVLPFPISLNPDGDDAERCRLICGFFGCDTRPFNPLLGSLPQVIHVPVSGQSWGWMIELLDAAVQAQGRKDAGQEAMLTKLSELMFLEALRAHLPGPVAHPVGLATAQDHLDERRAGRRRGRVSVGVRVQPRVQATGRSRAERLASSGDMSST